MTKDVAWHMMDLGRLDTLQNCYSSKGITAKLEEPSIVSTHHITQVIVIGLFQNRGRLHTAAMVNGRQGS